MPDIIEDCFAAVGELASCHLPKGSSIEVLTAIHSRLPAVPDFPPWGFMLAAAHSEDLRTQERHAPDLLGAIRKHLQPGRRHIEVTTKAIEGRPTEVILREAAEWGADRIVLGSHGFGKTRRSVLGSTAAAVLSGSRQ